MRTAWLRSSESTGLAGLSKEQTDVKLLALAMPWWPWIFAALAAALCLGIRLRWRRGLSGLLEQDQRGS
jgi:hypothetical protein